jgi:hypothetical protein
MLKFKSTTSVLMALSITTVAITPIINISSASAQLFPSQRNSDREYNRDYERNDYYRGTVIPEGTRIPVEYEKEKILVTKEETVPVTLTVGANIRDRNRDTLIPYGSEISGQIEPAGEGSRFVAQELILPDGTSYSIDADSRVVTRTETIKKGASSGDILKGAAIGGAAAAVLSGVLGDVNIEEVLGGAGLGALGGLLLGGRKAELISIAPSQDLELTLQSDLSLR